MQQQKAPKSRDGRLDLWRGLCLVSVVLVHLAYNGLAFPEPFDSAIKHYTRFAAGGFVFLAGLSVSVIFGGRVDRSQKDRWSVYSWCLKRGLYLLAVDTAAGAAYAALDLVRNFPADPGTGFPTALKQLIAFQRPAITGGILLFYVLTFALCPVLFEIRRRFGRLALLCISAILYGVAVTSGDLFVWPPFGFPLAFWQLLFCLGLVSDLIYQRQADAALPLHSRFTWGVLALVAYGVVLLDVHGPDLFGVDLLRRLSPLDYGKTPLQPGAVLWYIVTVNAVLAWSSIFSVLRFGTRLEGWVRLLGRHSLLVYVAHVFTEALILEYIWSVWPPVVVRVALALADIGILVALAWASEERPYQHLLSIAASKLPSFRITISPRLAQTAAGILFLTWFGISMSVRQSTWGTGDLIIDPLSVNTPSVEWIDVNTGDTDLFTRESALSDPTGRAGSALDMDVPGDDDPETTLFCI